MGKRNNQLKILANIAKQRLIKGEYNEPESKSIFVPKVSNYFIKNACAMKRLTAKVEYIKIDGKIDSDFENKVNAMLDNDYYCLNPIAQLIDDSIYDNLTDIEKQHYILNVAEKYNYIKEQYINKEKEAI